MYDFQKQYRKREIEIRLHNISVLSIIARKQLDLVKFHRHFLYKYWTSIYWMYDEYVRKDAILYFSTIRLTPLEFATVYNNVSNHLLELVAKQTN